MDNIDDDSGVQALQNVNINGGQTISESNNESPRVSTVDTDEAPTRKQSFAPETADYSTSLGLDSLHWGGVKKKDFDARSVASSMAAEKDDKSIYEEPAVGAVEEEESDDEEDDDDAPEEIILPQAEMSVDRQSIADSAVSKQGSLADISEQISPRQNEMRLESRSQAQSTDNGSVRPTSEDGEYEEVGLGGSTLPPVAISIASSAGMEQVSPRSPHTGIPHSPVSRNSAEMENVNLSSPSGGASIRPQKEEHPLANNAPGGGAPKGYQSKTMQQITTADQDEEEEKEHEQQQEEEATAAAVPGAAISNHKPIASTTTANNAQHPLAAGATTEEGGELSGASSAPVIEHFQIEGASSGPLPVSAVPTATVAAAAANGISLSTQAPTSPRPRVDMGPEWEGPFKGLLYYDGVDALGRPIVVLNADAVPSGMRSSALIYVKTHLDPLVNQGDYVLVCTARKARLPSLWIMSAYQNLPRPFRKNVQYVVLVRPTGFLRTVLTLMRPFISAKAHRKIKTVESLEEISEATGGEVTLQHLGARFLTDDESTLPGTTGAEP